MPERLKWLVGLVYLATHKQVKVSVDKQLYTVSGSNVYKRQSYLPTKLSKVASTIWAMVAQ